MYNSDQTKNKFKIKFLEISTCILGSSDQQVVVFVNISSSCQTTKSILSRFALNRFWVITIHKYCKQEKTF